LAHWLFVPGQNSWVAVTVFYREVHYFRVARNPAKIDAKRGDHCLQADFTGLIPPWKPDSFRLADHTSGMRRAPAAMPSPLTAESTFSAFAGEGGIEVLQWALVW